MERRTVGTLGGGGAWGRTVGLFGGQGGDTSQARPQAGVRGSAGDVSGDGGVTAARSGAQLCVLGVVMGLRLPPGERSVQSVNSLSLALRSHLDARAATVATEKSWRVSWSENWAAIST